MASEMSRNREDTPANHTNGAYPMEAGMDNRSAPHLFAPATLTGELG